MPMRGGIQFLDFFQELNFDNLSEVKIIFLTTFPLNNDFTDFKKVFKISCIEKPLTIENLNQALL
jgi:two-component SAPR family response regulator